MSNLIKFQLRNMFHSKLFYICLGLVLLMSPIMAFITTFMPIIQDPIKVFPQMGDFLFGELGIITTIFVVLFACHDYTEGTVKNIIARGYTKMQLLLSYYIVLLIALLVMYLVVFIVTFILFINNGFGFDIKLLYPMINSLVEIVAFTVFFSTLSILLEKNGTAIIVCLLVPTIVSGLLGFLDGILKTNIADYWINNISIVFLENPTLANLSYSILFYLIYIVIIFLVGLQILNKKEIK